MGCCVIVIAALLVVGAVSHGIIRHIVQTLPLWIPIALGARGSAWSKWAGLPCFVFWLLLMTAIWLFLLGWAHLIAGTFSPTEVAMTLVIGLACALGIIAALRLRSAVPAWRGAGLRFLIAVFEIVALRVSFMPHVSHDPW